MHRQLKNQEQEPTPRYVVQDMTADEIDDATRMRHQSWLDTYVNDEYGVTKEWIDEHFRVKLDPAGESARRERFLAGKANGTLQAYVVYDGDNKIIGCATPFIEASGAQRVGSIYTDSRYHGKGVGAALMQKIIDTFDPNKPIELEVAVYNEKAKAFYRKWGFIEQPGTENMFEKIPEIRMIRKAQNEISR